MRRVFPRAFVLLCGLVGPAAVAAAPTKLDPALHAAAREPAVAASHPKLFGVAKTAAGALLADVLIKTSDPGELAAILEQWG
ncbi:MAG: hypothetical protein HY543_13065, partial [Deltaproteobacteria bacterium]|nr:hypothetical protein [Deltaproteobacteria bacterium]